jgi:hypothetical protein
MRERMMDELRSDLAERSDRRGDDDSGDWDNAVRAYEGD